MFDQIICKDVHAPDCDGSGTDSGGSIGLGFSIPIDEVLPIVNQIIATPPITRTARAGPPAVMPSTVRTMKEMG